LNFTDPQTNTVSSIITIFTGGETLPGQKLQPGHSVYPKGVGPEAPAWVAFDRQVLCFDAYFQEAVHEKREEQYRVRRYVT
jgi:hypothetical protein